MSEPASAPGTGPAPATRPDDEPPPILGTWRNVYLALLAELALLVAAFFALTTWASP